MIDLHCHSTCSDGTVRPAELVRLAEAAGLVAVALTDHDTVAGIPEFLAAGRGRPIVCVPGVEISCLHGGRDIHLVGLFVEPDSGPLPALLETVRSARRVRNVEILDKLRDLGCELPAARCAELVAGEVTGRPHIAAALIDSGYCTDNRDAFTRFLGRGKPAFVPRRLCSVPVGIDAIHRSGGVAIWAHGLVSRGVTNTRFEQLATEFRGAGLDGLEAFYSEFSEEQSRCVLGVAERLGLLCSGGSDFHGEHIPDIALGVGYGGLGVPDGLLEPIRDRARQRAAARP